MKLGKAQKALLALTALFVVFTLAFFIGRHSVHAQITTEHSPEELTRELPEAGTETKEDLSGDIPETEPAGAPDRAPAGDTGRVDLNRADRAQLEGLPGIGPVLAERIIAWREEHGPFVSAEQIMDVEGIGEGKYADIKDLIYVEDGQ